MDRQRLVGNHQATWAGGAMGRKSNPLIDKVSDSVARGSVQQGIKCFNVKQIILRIV